MNLSERQRKIFIACGAGAGLAGVYSVPISGVFYTVEHLLKWDISLDVVVPAVLTSCTQGRSSITI